MLSHLLNPQTLPNKAAYDHSEGNSSLTLKIFLELVNLNSQSISLPITDL